ncbi:MAG: hypothetical protein U0W40_07705 [Acidimicrobiia bacterium]
MRQFPKLRSCDKIVVADIYDPFHLELLEQARALAPVDRQRLTVDVNSVLNEQLLRRLHALRITEAARLLAGL